MSATSGVRRGLTAPETERLDGLIRGQPLLHAISQLELSIYAGERLLRDTDMAGMRNSLEVRVPFLDHVVVETAARLPEARRFRPIQSKRVIRDVALRRLDPALFDRPRSGFVLPLDVWSRGALEGRLDATIADRGLCESAGVDPVVVQNLWRACRDGAPGMYWTRIWSVFALLEWVRAERVSLR
jgi:asparagine synthase (glutamine-hydrolysing)